MAVRHTQLCRRRAGYWQSGATESSFATERGRLGYEQNRRDFNKLIWHTASLVWHFDDATFNRTAESFNNADHASVVIHNYRWRLSLAPGEPRYDDVERKFNVPQEAPTDFAKAIIDVDTSDDRRHDALNPLV
jgi:hypothetical protein